MAGVLQFQSERGSRPLNVEKSAAEALKWTRMLGKIPMLIVVILSEVKTKTTVAPTSDISPAAPVRAPH